MDEGTELTLGKWVWTRFVPPTWMAMRFVSRLFVPTKFVPRPRTFVVKPPMPVRLVRVTFVPTIAVLGRLVLTK